MRVDFFHRDLLSSISCVHYRWLSIVVPCVPCYSFWTMTMKLLEQNMLFVSVISWTIWIEHWCFMIGPTKDSLLALIIRRNQGGHWGTIVFPVLYLILILVMESVNRIIFLRLLFLGLNNMYLSFFYHFPWISHWIVTLFSDMHQSGRIGSIYWFWDWRGWVA